MLSKIVPVKSSFSFGISDTLFLESASDNLKDCAMFNFLLGKMTGDVFVSDGSSAGSVKLDGEQYAEWTGANDALPALLAPKIGVELVA